MSRTDASRSCSANHARNESFCAGAFGQWFASLPRGEPSPLCRCGAVTAVFVHGVPETPAVWGGLLAALGRLGSGVLPLPGFGGARPEGAGAAAGEYAAWHAAQLERR